MNLKMLMRNSIIFPSIIMIIIYSAGVAECARRLFIFDMHSGLIKLFKMFSVN